MVQIYCFMFLNCTELGTHHVTYIFLHVLELRWLWVVQLIREDLVSHAEGSTVCYWGTITKVYTCRGCFEAHDNKLLAFYLQLIYLHFCLISTQDFNLPIMVAWASSFSESAINTTGNYLVCVLQCTLFNTFVFIQIVFKGNNTTRMKENKYVSSLFLPISQNWSALCRHIEKYDVCQCCCKIYSSAESVALFYGNGLFWFLLGLIKGHIRVCMLTRVPDKC